MDDNGDWKQDSERPGAKQLRPVLATIGATGAAIMTPGGVPSMLVGMGAEAGERALFGKSLGDVTSNFVKEHNPFPSGKDHYLGTFGNMLWDASSEMVRPEYGLYEVGKSLYQFRKNTRLRIPISPDNYYRVVTNLQEDFADKAILDANISGVVRANPRGTLAGNVREHYIGPYFSKGSPFKPALDKNSKVIVAEPNSQLQWLEIEPHEFLLRQSRGTGQFTPLYKGVPNQSPTSFFHYYERGNNPISRFFWFRKDFNPKVISPSKDIFNYGKNSGNVVHMDHGDNTGFNGNGAYIKDGYLFPGHSEKQVPHSW